MFDYYSLQSKAGNPTLYAVVYTIVFAFLLSSLIAFTYLKTYRGKSYSRNFIQSIILCSIIASTVIQAIGDSVAIGLGVLGALSIVRFRINIKNPRNIIFMFASLAIGIACGVYGYTIAIVGTLGFCLIAFVLYHSPFGNTNYFHASLRFEAQGEFDRRKDVDAIISRYCEDCMLNQSMMSDKPENSFKYEYSLRFKKGLRSDGIVRDLKNIKELKEVKINFADIDSGI